MKKSVIISVLIMMIFVYWSASVLNVSAEPTKITPFVSLKQESSDNILFSATHEDYDLITTASGGIDIKQKTEVLDADLNARLDQLLYRDFHDLNSLDKFFSGNVNYKKTERLGFGASAKYSEDSRQDRETDTTGLIVSGDRKTKRISLSSNYFFSELTRGEIKFGYGRVNIDRARNDEDNDDFSVDISFSKNLSKIFDNTTGLVNFSYLRYTDDLDTTLPGAVLTSFIFQKNKSDIYQFSTGFSKDITELYNIYCQVGASYARTNEKLRNRLALTSTGTYVGGTVSPEKTIDTFGGVIAAGVNYSGLYYDMGISISRDMRGASGTNGAVQRSSVAGNISGKLTDKFSLTFDSSLYLNQNKRDKQPDTDDLTFNIQPGFRYKFSNNFSFSCYYRYTSVNDREINTTSKRNMFYFVIKKGFEF